MLPHCWHYCCFPQCLCYNYHYGYEMRVCHDTSISLALRRQLLLQLLLLLLLLLQLLPQTRHLLQQTPNQNRLQPQVSAGSAGTPSRTPL